MVYSPAEQFIVYGIKPKSAATKQPDDPNIGDDDGDIDLTIYGVIGTATNVLINTTRGKVPIFTMGGQEARAMARGQQTITGSIDQVIVNLTVLDQMLSTNWTYVTELEKNLVQGTVIPDEDIIEAPKQMYGQSLPFYLVNEPMLDSIKLDELSLIQAKPTQSKDGNVYYSATKLIDVEFHTYSYAKRSTDVVQLERMEFIARAIYPFTYKMMDSSGNTSVVNE